MKTESKRLVKKLREINSRSKRELLAEAADRIELLERRLEEISEERDEAVACLKVLADRHGECTGCVHEDLENGCGDPLCDAKKNNHWEWRGMVSLNRMLTLEELMDLECEPVYIVDKEDPGQSGWELTEKGIDYVEGRDAGMYSVTWAAYKRKPVEEIRI